MLATSLLAVALLWQQGHLANLALATLIAARLLSLVPKAVLAATWHSLRSRWSALGPAATG